MEIEKSEGTPTIQLLNSLKHEPVFWYMKHTPESTLVKIQHERLSKTVEVGTGKKQLKLSFNAETLGSNPEAKLNEDAFLNISMGEGRDLFAVLDGASSQKEISGLSKFGVRGAFYVSHLVALGFPNSSVHHELTSRKNLSAADVFKSVNSWIFDQMKQIEGVDYKDPLSIPGMAATFVLVDSEKRKLTIAHAADTVACICHKNGDLQVVTPNQNERFDQETLELAQKLAAKRNCTLRELMSIPDAKAQIKKHLRASFRKKINTPDGCGILNGMPSLVKNNLIFEKSIGITKTIDSLLLFSDGALVPFSRNKELTETIGSFLKELESSDGKLSVLEKGAQILEEDSEFEKIPRIKKRDDSTFVQISFKNQ